MLGFHAHAARLFSMKGFSIVASVLVGAVSGQGWPAQHEASSDTQPNIEVRLAPPARPLPEVAAEIALLESSRGSLEEAAFGKLQAAYNRALQDAKAKIGDVVGRGVGGTVGEPVAMLWRFAQSCPARSLSSSSGTCASAAL